MESNNYVSVICPVYNEEKYIEKCIESILGQDFPKSRLEVIFVDGMSSDKTRDIIKIYSTKYSFIRLIDNPEKIVPYAMNKGIKESKGDIIIRLDAHASYASNYFSELVDKLLMLNADNVGAPCKTDILNINKKTLVIKEILSNKFGVGNSLFRLGINKITEVDTVPFGCWKKESFNKFGFFDVRLVRNQDIEFNKRIVRNGGHIYLVPDTYSVYYARETFKGIAKNAYQNGLWNFLTVYYTHEKKSLSIRHFVPFLFVMSLLVPFVLCLLWRPLILISLFSLFLYFLVFTVISSSISFKKKLSFGYLLYGFFSFHLSYGIGSLIGLIKILGFRFKH